MSIHIQNKSISGTYTVFCRSPNNITNSDFMSYFENWCNDVCDVEKRNIICGDFNVNLLMNDTDCKRMKTIINNTGMKQYVRNATRITKLSKSLVDYVISDNFKLKVNVLTNEKISDHSTIVINLQDGKGLYNINKSVDRLVNYSCERLSSELLKVDW